MNPHASLHNVCASSRKLFSIATLNAIVLGALLVLLGGCVLPDRSPADSLDEGGPLILESSASNESQPSPTANAAANIKDPELAEIYTELEKSGELTPAALAQLAKDFQDPKAETKLLVQTFRAVLASKNKEPKTQSDPEEGIAVAADLPTSPRPRRMKPPTERPSDPEVEAELVSYREMLDESRMTPEAKVLGRKVRDVPEIIETTAAAKLPFKEYYLQETDDGNSNKTWREHLAAAVAALESNTAEIPRTDEEVHQQVFLRMMKLMDGQRDAALNPVDGISPSQKDYWVNQLYALAMMLDERNPNQLQQATEATRYLRMAAADLANCGALEVSNVRLCTKVSSYGVYDKFDTYEFKPADPLLLYAEVDNFLSVSAGSGFKTSLRVSYKITDDLQRVVVEEELPVLEEVCENRRRDFFILYRIKLPERIYEGKHKLLVSVEDTQARKFGTAPPVEFTVISK